MYTLQREFGMFGYVRSRSRHLQRRMHAFQTIKYALRLKNKCWSYSWIIVCLRGLLCGLHCASMSRTTWNIARLLFKDNYASVISSSAWETSLVVKKMLEYVWDFILSWVKSLHTTKSVRSFVCSKLKWYVDRTCVWPPICWILNCDWSCAST